MQSAHTICSPETILQNVFGYSKFRGCQGEVIQGVLQGRDQLVVMATGGGKSLCYQIPPLVLRKPAIVISPLISLMQDQVMALQARNIDACFLGSAQTDSSVEAAAWGGRYAFIYMTPELAVNRIQAIKDLQTRAGLSLVAVDEAHCVSEWGFDFRPEYRQLASLRRALPEVSFLALTATATPQVREDIVKNLELNSSKLDRWIQSFERPNLYFEVQSKASSLQASLASLVKNEASRGRIEPTIVYTISRREAQEIADALSIHSFLNGRVGCYHGDLSIGQRHSVHAAFLRDQLSIVCCTLAFGMGVDKSNVRRVVHYGLPASLEAYYQQAGRAGRDGLPAKCTLLWGYGDVSTQSAIKEIDRMSDASRASFQAALDSMMKYATTGECRHAVMVNHFDPGSYKPSGEGGVHCAGGCDSCKDRSGGDAAGSGASTSQRRDLTKEAKILLSALERLCGYGYGLSKVILLLRGSKSKEIAHLTHLTGHGSNAHLKLHGAGAEHQEDWWKGLSQILMGNGLAAMETRMGTHGNARAYSVIIPTAAGKALFASTETSGKVIATLTAAMLKEEKWIEEAKQAEKKRAEAGQAVQDEVQKLYFALLELRQKIAQNRDVPPEMIVSDAAVSQMAHKRPEEERFLAACEGCNAVFIQNYGSDFVKAIKEFCDKSVTLRRSSIGGWKSAKRVSNGSASSPAAYPPHLAKLLSEPRAAANEAYIKFAQGQTLAQIANDRPKPIQPMTVGGYVSDAAAAAGVCIDWLRLCAEAGLSKEQGLAIAQAIEAHGSDGFKSVREALMPSVAEYGQIKIIAAMMYCQQHWFDDAVVAGDGAAAGGASGDNNNNTSQVENKPTNNAVDPGQPAAKRPRFNAADIPADPSASAVLSWLTENGAASASQLAKHFCSNRGDGRQEAALRGQLSSALNELMNDLSIYKRGGKAATSSEIDFEDDQTMYLLF